VFITVFLTGSPSHRILTTESPPPPFHLTSRGRLQKSEPIPQQRILNNPYYICFDFFKMQNPSKSIFFLDIQKWSRSRSRKKLSLRVGIFWEHVKGCFLQDRKNDQKIICNKSLWKPFIADNCVSTPVCSRCISLSDFLKGLNAIIFNSAWAIWIEDQTLWVL